MSVCNVAFKINFGVISGYFANRAISRKSNFVQFYSKIKVKFVL